MEENYTNCPWPPANQTGWFSFMRVDGYPTRYWDQFNPAHIDVLAAGLILTFLILALCFYLILPGFSATRRRSVFFYVTISLFIGGVIVVCNFGADWEYGEVKIRSQYKPGNAEEIDASLGLRIALRGINITFRGLDSKSAGVDYNEHFSWKWAQGRFGFGKYAGRFNRDFRTAVLKGLPYPILQTAEYFTFDGEGIRFGRHYRLAGWYAHIMMWAAFPFWIMSNILLSSTIPSGAMCLGIAGILQLIAIGIWTFLRNPVELSIPFEAYGHHGPGHYGQDVVLTTAFGPDYYLVFINGLICVILGSVMWVLSEVIPDEACQFFGIDPLTSYDEYLPDPGYEDNKPNPKSDGPFEADLERGEAPKGRPLPPVPPGPSRPSQETPSGESICDQNTTVLRRKGTGKFQRSFRSLTPRATPRKKGRSSVRYNTGGSVTIEEEKEVATPLLEDKGRNKGHESDSDGQDYANLPPPPRTKKFGMYTIKDRPK